MDPEALLKVILVALAVCEARTRWLGTADTAAFQTAVDLWLVEAEHCCWSVSGQNMHLQKKQYCETMQHTVFYSGLTSKTIICEVSVSHTTSMFPAAQLLDSCFMSWWPTIQCVFTNQTSMKTCLEDKAILTGLWNRPLKANWLQCCPTHPTRLSTAQWQPTRHESTFSLGQGTALTIPSRHTSYMNMFPSLSASSRLSTQSGSCNRNGSKILQHFSYTITQMVSIRLLAWLSWLCSSKLHFITSNKSQNRQFRLSEIEYPRL